MNVIKPMEKKLDGNYTRMLPEILNKFWRQHRTKKLLYGHLPPIMKTIHVRRTRQAGHCWRSKHELISNILLRTPSHGRAEVGRQARTYLQSYFIAYRSSKVSSRPDCIFEIHQRWPSGFSRVYSNCCCSCSFKAEIIKIGQSSYKMYSNNIMNFQEFTTILNVCTKKLLKLMEGPT